MSSCAFEERHDLARAAFQGRGHRGRDAALVLGAAVSSSAMEPRDAGVWMETTAHAKHTTLLYRTLKLRSSVTSQLRPE